MQQKGGGFWIRILSPGQVRLDDYFNFYKIEILLFQDFPPVSSVAYNLDLDKVSLEITGLED